MIRQEPFADNAEHETCASYLADVHVLALVHPVGWTALV